MTDTKQITIKDFKMWLQGVEEMQDDNWTPSPSQWKRIREKIDSIYDGGSEIQKTTQRIQTPMTSQPADNLINNFPVPPSHIPFATQAPPPSAVNPLFGSPESGLPAKTPNVDTTDGKPYKSSFT